MEFTEIVQSRYATKKFTGEKITEAQFTQLQDLITLSASSFGLQPYKIIVVESDELKAKLAPAAYDQPQITTASHVLVFCAYSDIAKRIAQYDEMLKISGTPDASREGYIGMMKQSLLGLSDEQKVAWAKNQVYIALGNAINGAKAVGVDSCPMEGFDASAFSQILGLSSELTPVVLVPVGIAADTPRPKLRYTTDELYITEKDL